MSKQKELIEQIAALTAENVALREWEDTAKQLDKAKLPCGHNARYGYTEDGGKHGVCVLCENARLKAPVNDEEKKLLHKFGQSADWHNSIIAARASTPLNTSWFCVPCGFTTRDAAEAQAHLGPHMIELTCPFDGQIWRFHTQAQADMLQKHLDWHAAQLLTPITPEAR